MDLRLAEFFFVVALFRRHVWWLVERSLLGMKQPVKPSTKARRPTASLAEARHDRH
jgi:hypothetical protein